MKCPICTSNDTLLINDNKYICNYCYEGFESTPEQELCDMLKKHLSLKIERYGSLCDLKIYFDKEEIASIELPL